MAEGHALFRCEGYGGHRVLHHSVRRQRQMCRRDRPNTRRLEALPGAHRAVQNANRAPCRAQEGGPFLCPARCLECAPDCPVGAWKCFQAPRVGHRRGPQGSARAARFQARRFGPTTRFSSLAPLPPSARTTYASLNSIDLRRCHVAVMGSFFCYEESADHPHTCLLSSADAADE